MLHIVGPLMSFRKVENCNNVEQIRLGPIPDAEVVRFIADSLHTETEVAADYFKRLLGEHEELVAVPALELDVALVHQHRADRSGNAAWLGEDPFMDDLFVRAAQRSFVSCEQVVGTEELASLADLPHLRISRMDVTGVVEAPNGAHFTECGPDYGRDEAFQKEYAATAKDPDAWAEFKKTYLDVESEAEYQKAVAKR